MKKSLLGTTAFIATLALSAPAQAQFDITLGGYVDFVWGMMDDDLANRTSQDMMLATELWIDAEAKSDNGLTYGVAIEIQNGTDNSTSIDDASLYIAGSFGRLQMGDFDGPADSLAIWAPVIGISEQLDGYYLDFVGDSSAVSPAGALKGIDSDNSTKIAYITPEFKGFQAGISYAPQEGDTGTNIVTIEKSNSYKDWIEGGISYRASTDRFSYGFAATLSSASADGQAAYFGGNSDVQDFTAYQIGAEIGYGRWTLGMSYADNDDYYVPVGESADQKAFNIGLAYEVGAWSANAQYLKAEGYYGYSVTGSDGNSYDYADDYQAYAFGVNYEMAPGLNIGGDLVFFDSDVKASPSSATTDRNKGHVALLYTSVTF